MKQNACQHKKSRRIGGLCWTCKTCGHVITDLSRKFCPKCADSDLIETEFLNCLECFSSGERNGNHTVWTPPKAAFDQVKVAFFDRPVEEGIKPPPGWEKWMNRYGVTSKGKFFIPAVLASTKPDGILIEFCRKYQQSAFYNEGKLFIPLQFAIQKSKGRQRRNLKKIRDGIIAAHKLWGETRQQNRNQQPQEETKS